MKLLHEWLVRCLELASDVASAFDVRGTAYVHSMVPRRSADFRCLSALELRYGALHMKRVAKTDSEDICFRILSYIGLK